MIQKEAMVISPVPSQLNVIRIGFLLCFQRSGLPEVKGSPCHRCDFLRNKIGSIADIAVCPDLQQMADGRTGKVTRQIEIAVVGQVKISILIGDCFILQGKAVSFGEGVYGLYPAVSGETVQSVRQNTAEADTCTVFFLIGG